MMLLKKLNATFYTTIFICELDEYNDIPIKDLFQIKLKSYLKHRTVNFISI